MSDFSKNKLKQRLFKAFGTNAYGQLVTIAIQILGIPIFLKVWGSEKYGEWLILFSVPYFLSLCDLGFATVSGNEMAMSNSRGDRRRVIAVFQSASLIILIFSLLFFAALVAFVYFIDISNIFNIVQIERENIEIILVTLAAYVVLVLWCGMMNAALRAVGLYAVGGGWMHSIRLLEWAVGIIGLVVTEEAVVVALCMLMFRFLGFFVGLFLLNKLVGWISLGVTNVDVLIIKKLVRPSLAFMSFPVGLALTLQGTVVLLGMFCGAASVTVFTVCRTVARICIQFAQMISQSVWVELSAAHGREDNLLVRSLYCKSFFLVLAGGMIISLLVGWLGEYIIGYWAPDLGNDYLDLLWLLLAGSLINVAWQTSWVLLMSINQHVRLANFFLLLSLILILSMFIFLNFSANSEGVAMLLLIFEVILFYIAVTSANRAIGIGWKKLLAEPVSLYFRSKNDY